MLMCEPHLSVPLKYDRSRYARVSYGESMGISNYCIWVDPSNGAGKIEMTELRVNFYVLTLSAFLNFIFDIFHLYLLNIALGLLEA